MKSLKDFEKQINRCSKCGLCQSVCPVYKETGNDCAVSRGKFIILRGILKGDLTLNKTVNKYLDMCLKCNACKDFCPSGIDAKEIFLTAKAEYFKTSPVCKIIGAFHSKFIFKTFLNAAKLASSIYRFLKFDKLVAKFYPVFKNSGFLGRKVILANEFVKIDEKQNKANIQNSTNKTITAVYFKGCVNEKINPKVKNAAESILKKAGVKILPINFDCCGMPFLSAGNAEQFKKQAISNLSKINADFDYFLTDCASCEDAFREYENYFDDEEILQKLRKINQKSINICDFIAQNVKKIEFNDKKTVTFHKPCHLENMDFFKNLIEISTNIEYVEMKEYDSCCGLAGAFVANNPKLSENISSKKAQNILSTGAEYVLTTCPACTLGLTQGLINEISDFSKMPKVLNLVEFIAIADKIIFHTLQTTDDFRL